MPFNGINSLQWQIVVQTRTANTSTKVVTWSNSAPIWASVETRAAGPEVQAGSTVVGLVDYLMCVPSKVAIDATNRIVFNGKTLQVQSVRMLDRSFNEVFAREKQ
jgi:head-tail adaptor